MSQKDISPEEREKTRVVRPKSRSLFVTRTRENNFLLCVLVVLTRMAFVALACLGIALAGALVGIAKAYVDTAPTLDLAAIGNQEKTSFLYDSEGNLITDYKGTQDRVVVSLSEMPLMLRSA